MHYMYFIARRVHYFLEIDRVNTPPPTHTCDTVSQPLVAKFNKCMHSQVTVANLHNALLMQQIMAHLINCDL